MKIKFPQKYRLGQLLYNKKFTVVLSVVLAFALWLGISMTENPIRQQTFSDLSALVTLDGTAAADLGLGIVSDVSQTGANDVWHIRKSDKEYLIPCIDDVVISVDVENNKVVLKQMKGLFDDED